jgi:hypothetical protein
MKLLLVDVRDGAAAVPVLDPFDPRGTVIS